MFEGEFASLKAISDTATVAVPEPIRVLSDPEHGSMLITEFMEGLSGLRGESGAKLGDELAQLHLHENPNVTKFGFDTPTCCGSIPQSNQWMDDWPVDGFFLTANINLMTLCNHNLLNI